jgi:hypothetical protein
MGEAYHRADHRAYNRAMAAPSCRALGLPIMFAAVVHDRVRAHDRSTRENPGGD